MQKKALNFGINPINGSGIYNGTASCRTTCRAQAQKIVAFY